MLTNLCFLLRMENSQEISVEIDPGKTLEIRLQAVSEVNEEGDRKVFFELNGQPGLIEFQIKIYPLIKHIKNQKLIQTIQNI